MPSTIILGYDASDEAREGLALARTLAAVTGARIVLVCALPSAPADPGDDSGVERRERDETMRRLEEAGALLDGVDHEVRAVPGRSASRALYAVAEQEAADLIVVGPTHHGALGRVTIGSVGERLLHGGPCAVAVAPRGYADVPEPRLAVIGVAYDASPESQSALASAVGLAQAAGAALELISVVEALPLQAPVFLGGHVGYEEMATRRETVRHRQLDEAVAGVAPDVAATPVLLEGNPARRLAEHSTGLGLLVMGSRAYGPVRSVMLGSVSGELMHSAACPLLVAPRGVDRPFGAAIARAMSRGE